MAFCEKCGSVIEEGTKFCPDCGEPAGSTTQSQSQANSSSQANQKTDFTSKIQELNNTADTTANFGKDDIEKNKVMAILAYFGPLVLVPILAAKDSKFSRYHANQGLVLFIASLGYTILLGILGTIIYNISYKLGFIVNILSIVNYAFGILAIIGIINAASGKAKELPLVGKIKILK